jgi:F-type H+-transporting ATPase subunit delta
MASVASTYARAFAEVAFDAHLDAGRAINGMRQIATLFRQSPELRRVWENPAVPADQKRGLLDAIVEREGIDRPVRNLIAVLMDHRRLPFLPSIVEHLEKELDARLGFTQAQISSARELAEAEKRTLEAQIAKTTGKKVRASYGLDKSLLGGAVVRIGSTIYDGSVKGQLEKIKEAISSQ